LTIDAVPTLTFEATCTVKVTSIEPWAGTLSPFQVTAPPSFTPPWPADTNVVLAGTGSVIRTPVASPLPMLRSVIVYWRSLDGPIGTSALTLESTSAGTSLASSIVNALRRWVTAAIVRQAGIHVELPHRDRREAGAHPAPGAHRPLFIHRSRPVRRAGLAARPGRFAGQVVVQSSN
jgi:hypothetical protein